MFGVLVDIARMTGDGAAIGGTLPDHGYDCSFDEASQRGRWRPHERRAVERTPHSQSKMLVMMQRAYGYVLEYEGRGVRVADGTFFTKTTALKGGTSDPLIEALVWARPYHFEKLE